MKGYSVKPISYSDAKPWIMTKHYAHRMPCVQHSFGLYNLRTLEGVVSYGPPPTPAIKQSVFNGLYQETVLELNRLCVNSKNKNACSFLVGRSLKMLPRPTCVVSYADSSMSHVGYIYQATNFIYTGSPTAHDSEYIINGRKTHARNLTAQGITAPKKYADEHGIEIVKPKPKHRYFYFCGTKKQRKQMLAALVYEILPYPKGDTSHYEITAKFHTQELLFV